MSAELGQPGWPDDPVPYRGTVLREMVRTMLSHPYLLGAALITMALNSSLKPAFGLMGKLAADDLSESGLRSEVALPYAPWLALLLVGWLTLQFSTEFARKTYRARMTICLQRIYLARITGTENQSDVARILWDATQGERGIQVVYEDAPQIIAPAVAVLGWQLVVAPKWLPALLVAVLPTFIAVFVFGPFIQRSSLRILEDIGAVAQSTEGRKLADVHQNQESLFRSFVRFELFRSGSNAILDALFWSGILLVICVDVFLRIPVVPAGAKIGDPIFFFVQLWLLSSPLARVGKTYNKLRAAYPAMLRVYRPGEEP